MTKLSDGQTDTQTRLISYPTNKNSEKEQWHKDSEQVNIHIKLFKTWMQQNSYPDTQQPQPKPPNSVTELAEKCLYRS